MNPRVLYRAATYATDARSTADSVISALTPAAWYRNATDVVSSGGFASIWADYADSNKGLVLPGVAGNYASAPDSAAISITGDIEIQIKVRLSDYTPGSNTALVTKHETAGQKSFNLWIATTGVLVFAYSPDGTATISASASAATGVTDGDITWFKTTFVSATGKVNFYKSTDGSAWSAIGVEQTIASGSIFNGTDILRIGSGAANVPINGTVYRTVIKSGIDGTTVFDADFSAQAIGAGSFTESSSNAATVTINTSGALPAHIGKARDLLQGTGTNQPAYSAGVFTFDGVDNYMTALTWAQAQPITLVLVGKQVTWTITDRLCDGTTADTASINQLTGTPTVGANSAASNTDWAVNTRGIVCAVFNGASSSLRVNNNAKTTGNAGAVASGGFILGARAGPGQYGNLAAEEVIMFPSALSDANQSAVITTLNNALTVF